MFSEKFLEIHSRMLTPFFSEVNCKKKDGQENEGQSRALFLRVPENESPINEKTLTGDDDAGNDLSEQIVDGEKLHKKINQKGIEA